MKTVITKESLVPISLVITLCGGIFWLSAMHERGVFNSDAILKMDGKIDRLIDSMQQTHTDVEVVKSQVKAMQKPLANTQANVKHISSRLEKMAKEAISFNPPVTWMEQGNGFKAKKN